MSDFTIKDSGQRQQFNGGMQRDTEDGKIDYDLILDGPMFERWAEHMTKGAKKYDARNWMKAESDALPRARRSLLRHVIQYLRGDTDEDHGAAIFFNVNLIEYIKSKKKELLKWPEKGSSGIYYLNGGHQIVQWGYNGEWFAWSKNKGYTTKEAKTRREAALTLGLEYEE